MVYFLEFSRPIGGRASYYIGWTKDEYSYISRMKQHKKGEGAAITRAAVAQGITWKTVAIVPEATRQDERRFKNWKNTRKLLKTLWRRGYSAGL